MTTQQLTDHFNQNYGMFKTFPETFKVNHETYANICHHLFLLKAQELRENGMEPVLYYANVALGRHNGILFKGVELILSEDIE